MAGEFESIYDSDVGIWSIVLGPLEVQVMAGDFESIDRGHLRMQSRP